MHQHWEWRSTNMYQFKLVPNPKWVYLLLGDFRELQTGNLKLCSIKSLLTAHLAPDDWNSSDAFVYNLKTSWNTPVQFCTFKTPHEDIPQQLRTCLLSWWEAQTGMNGTYSLPDCLADLVFIRREYPTCPLKGGVLQTSIVAPFSGNAAREKYLNMLNLCQTGGRNICLAGPEGEQRSRRIFG